LALGQIGYKQSPRGHAGKNNAPLKVEGFMKNGLLNIALCSLIALFPFSNSEALITDTNDLEHVFSYHKEDTLYVFDLDNTLIETAQYLGSDQWFSHQLNHEMESEGISRPEAVAKTLPIYFQIMNKTAMRLVDNCAIELLEKMKKKKTSMIGLTKRDPGVSARTLEQIAPLQIDFSSTCPLQGDFVFEELNGTVFKNGILFIEQSIEKGPALLAYLKKLKKMPKRIVAIDDRLNHIENIAAAVEPLGIDYVGIRYGKADERVKSFDPKIAAMQLEHFNKILSDEEALHLLNLE
jgi:hypothetical protein